MRGCCCSPCREGSRPQVWCRGVVVHRAWVRGWRGAPWRADAGRHVDSQSTPPGGRRHRCHGQPRARCGADLSRPRSPCRLITARAAPAPADVVLAARPASCRDGSVRGTQVHLRQGPPRSRPRRAPGSAGACRRRRCRHPRRGGRGSGDRERDPRERCAEHLRTGAWLGGGGGGRAAGRGPRDGGGPDALRRRLPASRGGARTGLRRPSTAARWRTGDPAAAGVRPALRPQGRVGQALGRQPSSPLVCWSITGARAFRPGHSTCPW